MKFISKTDLLAWLSHLLGKYRLIAPTSAAGVFLFASVSRREDIALDFDNTVLSPKEFFFPTSEVLFQTVRKDGHIELTPAHVKQETVIFGIRPCDARGMALIDKPFLQPPGDSLYQEHRDKTILVGLSCTRACPGCFCTSLGGAPNDPTYVDILLTEMDEGYCVQVVSEKGTKLAESAPLIEREGTPPLPPQLPPIPCEGVEKAMRRVFENTYWERVADRCIHCNICAYVCPTCYCFDIRDYSAREGGERVRSWDSCQSPGFTRIAGGYNPRATKGARLRQRFYHKLLYYPEEFGPIGCVGCGRCVRSCPVNIDIREIIADVHRLVEQNA